MVEKLSENFWLIALIAVLTTTSAVMPNAMIKTVSTVRSILLRTERKASDNISRNFISDTECSKVGQLKVIKFDNRST